MVVGLRGDIEVLEPSSPVEGDLLGLDFSVFNIDFVTDEANGDALTDSGQVLVPFGDIFVGNSGADIKRNNSALPANIVSFSEPSKLFLPCSVPNVELDWPVVGVENDGVHIDASRRC